MHTDKKKAACGGGHGVVEMRGTRELVSTY